MNSIAFADFDRRARRHVDCRDAAAGTRLAQTPSAAPPARRSAAPAAPQRRRPSPADQRHEIEGIVKDYLVSHPEVLQEAMDALDKRQKEADADKARTDDQGQQRHASSIRRTRSCSAIRRATSRWSSSSTTIAATANTPCPTWSTCSRPIPNLKFVLKEFPVLGEGSVEAAHVAVAARMQDPTGKKYIEFHQKLLGGRGPADKARALAVAKEVGFDMARIEKDMDSDEVKTTIDENMKLADALGVNGTPSYVVGDEVIVGAVGIDELKDKIQAERK